MEALATATKRILICDDQDDTLDSTRQLLALEGYDVVTARNHVEFFERFKSSRPDLLILDIRMPSRDGFCIAETVQVLDNHIPIIFFTGYDRPLYRMYSTVADGAADYLVKPVDPDRLLASVKRALSLKAYSSSCFLPAAPAPCSVS